MTPKRGFRIAYAIVCTGLVVHVDLPINGRDYLQLPLLSVGAGQAPVGRMNTFSASGQRAYNAYLLDRVDNNTLQARLAIAPRRSD